LAQLHQNYPEDVRIVFRHFPLLSIHDKAALAVQAAEAAGAQGEFWAMHDLLFEQQGEWSALSVEAFQDWLVERAGEAGLDGEQFRRDLTSQENIDLAEQAWEQGQAINLPGTPSILINGRYYQGQMDYWSLETISKLIMLEERQFAACPPLAIDPLKQYIATLETGKGDIVLELYPEAAPVAVNSFVFLARNGWFDGITFHRVIPDFVAQAGDPTGTGFGGPGYAFENEISPDLKFDKAGVVAMANAGPGSNGSQFFITFAPVPRLDGGYTIFGQVIEGLEVAQSLAPRDPQQGADLPPGDTLIRVTIQEK
jgi:cyclophilin family peptidyl-prolyl cis-trans isomerase